MKKIYFLFFGILLSNISFGQILTTENFTYPDGSLVGNGSWVNHSGTAGDLMVASGKAIIQTVGSSEDANLPFTAVSGDIYFGIDFIVTAASGISGDDYEYFAHFKDQGSNFRARLDIVAPSSAASDFTVGISSSSSTAQAIWATDLTFGETYRAIVRYDQDSGQAELWINAASESDTSITGTADGATAIESFAFRQSNSSGDETISIDNLIVSQSFNETLSTKENKIESFSIYPNPVSQKFVAISSKSNTKMTIQVFDTIGKLVINELITNNTLDISSLNRGILLLKQFKTVLYLLKN